MAQFLDISSVPDHACDHGLEAMYKAIGDGDGDSTWNPHESPFIRELIERFTQRGLMQLEGVRRELGEWGNGEHYRAGVDAPATFAGGMGRWTPDELRLARLYLEALQPDRYTVDDWSLLVDYLAQRYLPPDFARTAGEWMATKATIMGAVQQAQPEIEHSLAARVMEAAPATAEGAAAIGLNQRQLAISGYGRARCAENIVAMTDAMRHRIKSVIVTHQEAVFLGDKAATAESLQTKLFDVFSGLNRDWRRIAMTEAAENSNQGFIAALPPGATVRRHERYKDACAFCRQLDGREFTVVDPAQRIKDPERTIWPGKTNVGRSASPMRRVNGQLIPRDPSEMWWPAAGTQHPHCRGIWVEVKKPDRAGDPKFSSWLDNLLKAPTQ